ncbi:MAG: hypothetical protein RLZZ618_2751 [Pseudomonadota bacterium]|jgi:polyisoprenoid-binding protein YceI
MNKTLITLSALSALAFSPLAQAQAATYTIDPTHTFVNFETKHYGTSTLRGRFDKKEGSVSFDKAARTGKVDITIDTTSVSTGVAPLDGHLKSADFFNATEFPTAKFSGDKFVSEGGKLTSVSGTLTFLGKTQPVTLTASNFNCYTNPRLQREVCGGDFETSILRTSFGNSFGVPGIPDSIRLLIQVEAIKQ